MDFRSILAEGLSPLNHNPARIQPADAERLRAFWLSCEARGLRPKTIDGYAERINYLIGYAGTLGKGICQITKQDVESYIADHRRRVSAETVNGRLRVWRVLYNFICDERLADEPSPLQRVSLLPVEERFRQILQPDDVQRMIDACSRRTRIGLRNRLILLVLYDTMIRVGELVNMTVESVDLQSRTIAVKGKSHCFRFVPMTPATAQAMAVWLARYRKVNPADPVFCSKTGLPMTTYSVYLLVRKIGLRHGMHVTPHRLRHSSATLTSESGADIGIIQKILGHTDIRTTQRYLHQSIAAIGRHHDQHSPARRLLT